MVMLCLLNVHFAVVVAVIATRTVQVTTDQIVSMVAMWNAGVSASGAVLMSLVVR